jgi:hypothetical protein
MKRHESAQRNRYTRELSRYLTRMAALLADEKLSNEAFVQRSAEAFKRLEAIESVVLYSGHYATLLGVVNALIERREQLVLQEHFDRADLEGLSQWLQHQLNQLEKARRQSSYSRKRRSSDRGEWDS